MVLSLFLQMPLESLSKFTTNVILTIFASASLIFPSFSVLNNYHLWSIFQFCKHFITYNVVIKSLTIFIDLKCGNPVYESPSHTPRIIGGVPVDPVGAHPWLHSLRKYWWPVSKMSFQGRLHKNMNSRFYKIISNLILSHSERVLYTWILTMWKANSSQ